MIATAILIAALLAAPHDAAATPAPGQQQDVVPADATTGIAEALALVNEGDLAGAITAAEALCDNAGERVAACALLGSLHVEAGAFDRAMEILAPLTERETPDAGVLYNAGRASEGAGRIEDAVDYYGRSLGIQPHSPTLRALGMMLGRHGQPAEAYLFLQRWTASNPGDLEARVAAAAGAIALERAPEAEALLEGLPADEPGVKMLRAQVLLQQADPWGAINELRDLAAEPPPDIGGGIRRTLARAYLIVGEAEGALEQMKSLEAAGPEDAVLLASAWFQAGRLDEAIATLAPYAEPLPGSPRPENPPPVARDIVLEYGRYLHSAGEAARAVPFLRLATELDAGMPDAYQALGQALAASGEREEAREILDRFQVLSRDASDEVASVNERRQDIADPTGREVRGALELAADGEIDEALTVLAREARLASTDPRPAYAASSILLDAGRHEEALAAADRALAAAPGRADGLYQRGAVLMSLERLAESEEMFRQALQAQPTHTATLSDYAVLLMSGARNGEAAGLLRRLLELRPGDPVARGHLDRLRATGAAGGDRTEELPPAALGRQLLRNRDFRAAEAPLDRAVLLDPDNASLRIDLASALWENNKPAEAELHAREAVALESSSAAAHRLLGGLLLWRGEHLEAAEFLERAAALAQPDAALLVDIARAWDGAAGDEPGTADGPTRLATAEDAYRRAVAAAPDHKEAIYGLARVLQRLGRNDEAEAQMERYMELYGEDQRATGEKGPTASEDPPDGN
ncbi:MAG: tetratricopeptide repeat protein [Acidobacteriota bacterium]|nr:tetratricopeptide repeat protein [Acidobacteriota bacterium]